MSDMESHTGKLIPMVLNGVSMEERFEDACNKLGYKFNEKLHDSWEECFKENCYRDAHVIGDVIYKVEDEELDPYGFATASRNEDGSINYNMMYYNGGASFTEALDGCIEYMERQDND